MSNREFLRMAVKIGIGLPLAYWLIFQVGATYLRDYLLTVCM